MKRLLAILFPLLLGGGPAFAATPSPAHHAHTPDGSRTGRHAAKAAASRDRQPAGKPSVDVLLNSITPKYISGGGKTIKVTGQVRDRTDDPSRGLTVRLLFSNRAFASRGQLNDFADGKGNDPWLTGDTQALRGTLAPGRPQAWTLKLPARRLGLPSFGVFVYPITIQVLNSAGAVIGRRRTFVTYCTKGVGVQRTRLSWIWPVIDQPHRADDSTFMDDRLDGSLGSGRLSHLVGAASQTRTPVTWLVDPALVDDAERIAAKDGYTTKDGRHHPASVAARTWLAMMRSAFGTRRLIATPYADPDVMALAHAGMSDDIRSSTAAGPPKLTAAGLTGAVTTVAVPPAGLADQRTLSALASDKVRTVVLSSAILPDAQAQTYTPDPVARRKVGGKAIKLVAYDDTISRALGEDSAAHGGAAATEQRFLAETAMITGEAPNNARSVVVMPPRRWSPGAALAKHLLTDSASVPWLRAVPFKNIEAQKPVGRTLRPAKDSTGLSKRYLRKAKDLSVRIRHFTSIFQPPVSGFTLGVARVESSAWSDHMSRGSALRGTLDNELSDATSKVRILKYGVITLAGRSGQFPITVANELDSGTVIVHLRAYSKNDALLHLEGVDHTLTLQPGHEDTVNLYAKVAANAPAYFTLELQGPDGVTFTDPQILEVRTTAYGRTALLITGASLAVLFLGVGVRVIRRRGGRGKEAEETSG